MRRRDREITDPVQIRQVIAACQICHLGLRDEAAVYVVPVNFGFEEKNGAYTLYFHGAKEGRKLELMKRCPRVGFEMECGYQLTQGETACSYSARFQSVIGMGSITFLENPEEKRQGLRRIMEQATGRTQWQFPLPMILATCVYKLEVEELSCKIHE